MGLFHRTAQPPPAYMREQYLDELPHPQEMFLEVQVISGTTWLLPDVGYIVTNNDWIVEFFLVATHRDRMFELYGAAVTACGTNCALCKSFDHLLLTLNLSQPSQITPTGMLFREIKDSRYNARDDVVIRAAAPKDVRSILAINDEFFADEGEIESYLTDGDLFVMHNPTTAQDIVNCGIGRAVIAGRDDIDIGMLTAVPSRGRGFGTHMIAFLKDHYLKLGLNPICGCSAANLASFTALQNAGFSSQHRLLQITPLPNI